MKTFTFDSTGQKTSLYPFLDGATSQKDTRLVDLLLELTPFGANHGTIIQLHGTIALIRFVEKLMVPDERYYIAFVSHHKKMAKINPGYNYQLSEQYEATQEAYMDRYAMITERAEVHDKSFLADDEVPRVNKQNLKDTGLDDEDNVDNEDDVHTNCC
jgi:hypothetical protein